MLILRSCVPGGLFGECDGHRVSSKGTFVDPCAVKFAYPRIVDYGQDNKHSPDGKVYFTSYGSSRPDGPVSWMSGDEAHMARVDPKLGPAAINNRSFCKTLRNQSKSTIALSLLRWLAR